MKVHSFWMKVIEDTSVYSIRDKRLTPSGFISVNECQSLNSKGVDLINAVYECKT
jgi:hypothetical protein